MGFTITGSERGKGKMAQHEQWFTFKCKGCGHETPVLATTYVDTAFDHIMECDEHFDEAVDYIFSEFCKDGVVTSVSGLQQVLRYLDEFIALMDAEGEEDEEGESIQSEDTDDDQSEERSKILPEKEEGDNGEENA